jgi:molybdopterin-guanine dinucleotide biosynthesis protein A
MHFKKGDWYHSAMRKVGGFVLAGGHSRRMGSDKALLLRRDGFPQLKYMTDLVAEATGGPATVVGPAVRYQHLHLPIVEDTFPQSGPLGGIHAALASSEFERNLIVAVDLPNLSIGFLTQLLDTSDLEEGTVPCVIARGQPLCGVYHRKSCLGPIEVAVARGMLKVTTFVQGVGARVVDPPEPHLLENMNALTDWQTHLETHE